MGVLRPECWWLLCVRVGCGGATTATYCPEVLLALGALPAPVLTLPRLLGTGGAAADLLDLADLPVVATDVVGEVLVGGLLAEALAAGGAAALGLDEGRFAGSRCCSAGWWWCWAGRYRRGPSRFARS